MSNVDPDLVNLMKADAPKINVDLARGLATIHMSGAEEYIDNIFNAAAGAFPPDVTYDGFRRCNPYQDHEYNMRKKGRHPQPKTNQKNTQVRYETAAYDFYMVEYQFSFKGEKLKPVPIALPFINKEEGLRIKSTQWYLSPVLADRVISVGEKNIFVRLQRDRLTFNRDPYRFKVNGVREDFSLVHSLIYHTPRKKGPQGPKMVPKGKTTMAHYLFCKYGVENAFQRFAGCTPIVGENLFATLDQNVYAVFQTTGIPPARTTARSRADNYRPPLIEVAVKHSEVNNTVRALVTGLFYVADLFPNMITAKYANDPYTWVAPMGYLLFPETMNRGRMQESILNHCESLDGYADPMVIESMRRIGIHIQDIYEFFAIIAADFDERLLEGITKVNSMYDKEMSVLYFVFFDLTSAIFNMLFGLKAAAKKEQNSTAENRKELTIRDVENIIRLNLKMTVMHDLQKIHGEVQNINYSGDTLAFKPTASLIPQTSTNKLRGNKGSERGVAHDATKRLHVSVAEIGSVSAMSKSDPTGRNNMNHYALLSPEDKSLVIRHPELIEPMDIVQEMIRRR